MKTIRLNESQLRKLIREMRGDLQVGDIVTVVPEYQHPVRVRVQEFIGDMRTVTTDAEPGEAFLGTAVSDADVPWSGGGDFEPGESYYFYVSEIEPDSWESGFFAED
jgi:hypothetical protein